MHLRLPRAVEGCFLSLNPDGPTQVLVDGGAEVDGVDDSGQTALHSAAFVGRGDIITFLLENGAAVGFSACPLPLP